MRSLRVKLTLAVMVLLSLSMVDILIEAIFDRGHAVKVVAGNRVVASAKLTGDIRPYTHDNAIFSNRVNDPSRLAEILTYAPRSDAFRLRFLELKGRVWRAEIRTDAGRPDGDYPIRVYQRGMDPEGAMPFAIRIFPDAASLRASQASLSRRFLGVPPWVLAFLLLPTGAVLIFLTHRGAAGSVSALQAAGIGPIYRMAYRRTGWQILFGLGSSHGVRPGDRLELLDARHRPTGHDLVATRVRPQSGEARLAPSVRLEPGYCVRRSLEPPDRSQGAPDNE